MRVVNGQAKIQNNFTTIKDDFDRMDKVLLVLLDKESLLEYFSDVPIEFMPEVLEFLQRNTQSNPSRYPLWH
jgi:hypothetical protein